MNKATYKQHLSWHKMLTHLAVAGGLTLSFSHAVLAETPPGLDRAILAQIQQHLKLTEEQAISRLQAEARANAIHGPIRDFLGDAYAGAWFDEERMQLAVAITNGRYRDWVRVAGAHPVIVARTLGQLRTVKQRLRLESEADQRWHSAATGWYIDYQTNQVVLEALEDDWDYVQQQLPTLGIGRQSIRLQSSPGRIELHSAIRGADAADGGNCSVGFSVVGGFVWAAHCKKQGQPVYGNNGELVGHVAGATDWQLGIDNRDRGWVSTVSGWNTLPEINGYGDGVKEIRGHSDAAPGTTVCRYGQVSKGPHCGEVDAKNQTQVFDQYFKLVGLTRVIDWGVSTSGDSGGPYISFADNYNGYYGVGTHVGSSSTAGSVTYFEPLSGTLSHFGLTLKTTQGDQPPAISSFVCPDSDNSGDRRFFCHVSYNTQGGTEVHWNSSSSGGTSSGDGFFGSCATNDWVTVSVTVSNAAGSDTRQSAFACPTNPLP